LVPAVKCEELASFVINTESITTSGNPSKGKCMDANLEEKNQRIPMVKLVE